MNYGRSESFGNKIIMLPRNTRKFKKWYKRERFHYWIHYQTAYYMFCDNMKNITFVLLCGIVVIAGKTRRKLRVFTLLQNFSTWRLSLNQKLKFYRKYLWWYIGRKGMFQDVDVKSQVRPYLNFDVDVLKHVFFPWIITFNASNTLRCDCN